MRIYTACKETGDFIEEVDTIQEGLDLIKKYELIDKKDSSYTPGFYNLVDENHKTINIENLKDYHKYTKKYIGSSDIATLVLAGCFENKGLQLKKLDFSGDGEYYAYIVDDKALIGSHYKKITTFNYWMKIYDDSNYIGCFRGSIINVYRACDFGCIIQIINTEEV